MKKSVIEYFKELSEIPRKSGDEQKIGDYLIAYATSRDLSWSRDAAGNVVIKKPSPIPQYTGPSVILQGHMDMVYEKEPDSNHCYEEGIRMEEVSGCLKSSSGTTLGADNGIGLALILRLLDMDDRKFPSLEALITTGEEEGLTGVKEFDGGELSGRFLLNLDGEEEGVFLTSCAGGARCLLTKPCNREKTHVEAVLTITLKGLSGGHSGLEIGLEKANAIQIMGRLMKNLPENVSVMEIDCPGKANAIAASGRLKVAGSKEALKEVQREAERLTESLKKELQSGDIPEFQFILGDENRTDSAAEVIPSSFICELSELLSLLPCGVFGRDQRQLEMVRTSANIGSLQIKDGKLQILVSCRSSIGSQKAMLLEQESLLAKCFGYEVEIFGEYPEWEYHEESMLRELCAEIYRKRTGKEAVFEGVHGGLECGYLSQKLGADVDMIAMGANLFDVHTPRERVDIQSVERMEQMIVEILERLA